jgi:Holliday junction resolvase
MAAEKNFENKVKKYLRDQNCWYIKYWAGPKFTKDGVPDILACCSGKFFALEVKASSGKPSLLQLVTLEKIRNSGGYGILLYPEDFNGFQQLLNGNVAGKTWYITNLEKQRIWFEKLDT